MRIVLTPTLSININQPRGKIMSDMKLFDADGEVRVGDVVRFNKKPCYVERIGELVTIVSMDERKYTYNVQPHQINCVLQRGEGNGRSPTDAE